MSTPLYSTDVEVCPAWNAFSGAVATIRKNAEYLPNNIGKTLIVSDSLRVVSDP